jgi:hypothetical protein
MIENDNISTEIGDIIIFQTVPMLNVQTITSYADSVTGEVGTSRYFDREYQYSIDGGVTWSDWYNLNGANVSNILNINLLLQSDFHQLVIQFKFTRSGTDVTSELQINSISINGTNVERGSVFMVGGTSIFSETIYNNIDVINLMVNLAQKMYDFGVVPAYFTRQIEDTGFNSDAAYIDFWEAIAYFYAVILVDSKKFENVYWRRPLLCEFLTEKNIFLCDCSNIIQMQLIAQNFLTEVRVRGTEEIFKPAGYEYSIGYRNTYTLPTSYVIQPSTSVQIDGIVYPEISALPFGWTLNGDVLVANDRNTHAVLFYDATTDAYEILPTGVSIVFPTDTSNILKLYDGEYLRLICFNGQCDAFIYNNISDIFQGWCLSNASPCYQGLRPQQNKSLILAYEQQASVLDLTKYPLINAANIYIGVANNPNVVSDTMMYISSNGSPCFPGVPQQQINVSTHFTVNIVSTTLQVSGLIKLTNLLTLDEFDTPVTLGGGQNIFTIDTDINPAQYSVELIFEHSGTMISEVTDDAGIDIFESDTTGNIDLLYSLNNVGSPLILVNLNFS